MAYEVIENVEDRVGDRVIRRKIIKTDDAQYPSGFRYALHYAIPMAAASLSGTIMRTKR